MDLKTNEVIVLSLVDNLEYTFVGIDCIDALISQAILNSNQHMQVSNNMTRAKYRKKVLYGRYTASIGDLAVLTS